MDTEILVLSLQCTKASWAWKAIHLFLLPELEKNPTYLFTWTRWPWQWNKHYLWAEGFAWQFCYGQTVLMAI